MPYRNCLTVWLQRAEAAEAELKQIKENQIRENQIREKLMKEMEEELIKTKKAVGSLIVNIENGNVKLVQIKAEIEKAIKEKERVEANLGIEMSSPLSARMNTAWSLLLLLLWMIFVFVATTVIGVVSFILGGR
ncbi:MAG: hypothetical protein ACXAEU_23875 [Candidatus Hodarchaeales archaeon]|jgi:hypothetical protein